MSYFKKRVTFQIREDWAKEIEELVKESEKYVSISHFMRCAVVKLLKENE